MANPHAVLFVCNHNAIRSPMAEGLMARRFANRIWTRSCGVRPGRGVDPLAIEVMDELGVDISARRPQGFAELGDFNYDLIVTLAPEAHHRALELTRTLAAEVEYWATYDPSQAEGSRSQRLAGFRAVRDALDERIARRFSQD